MSSSKFTKSKFNVEWMDPNLHPGWHFWIKDVPNDPYVAQCVLCQKRISLSNMGKQAVSSHEQSAKHKKNMQASSQVSIVNFVKSTKDMASDARCGTPSRVESKVLLAPNSSALSAYLIKESVLKAEIMWAMKLVSSHSSLNAFDDAVNIFASMFSDSEIAKKCTLGRSKMSYLITYGLAPFFHDALQKTVKGEKFVICFDEALNRVAQRCQMDIVVRFWSPSHNKVETRYWNSVFMGHATSEILVEKLKEGVLGLDLNNLIQISMDGPSVNMKFLRNIKEDLYSEYGCTIFDLGTCGLHIIHGAFQWGHKATMWGLEAILRAFHMLFKDSPARRADYTEITGSSVFPLKFCQVRWVENVVVTERAINVFGNIKKYVKGVKSLPCTVTCDNVEKACEDKLILAKLAFFSYIANILEPFLRRFQSPKPMVPFLYSALHDLIYQLMKSFIKKDVLQSVSTLQKLFQINLDDKKNYSKTVDIGIAAAGFMNKSGASELQKCEFQHSCLKFFQETTKKIITRTSASFRNLKAVSSLDPKLMLSNPVLSVQRMSALLQLLHEKEILSATVADKVKQQFDTFISRIKSQWGKEFTAFSENSIRLDTFYTGLLQDDEYFSDMWRTIKTVLILSQGNAPVESGFSINKDMLIENLQEDSLIGLRTVYDAIKTYDGVLNVPITKEMLQYAKGSRARYHQYLEGKSQEEKRRLKQNIEKRRAADQIKELQRKKNKVEQEAHMETNRIEQQIAELTKYK